MVDLSKQR